MIPRSEDTIPGGYIETCGCWRDQAALLRDQSERAISFTPAPSHHHRYHNWGQCFCHCHHHWVAEINIFTSAFLLSSSLASKSLMVPQLHSMPRKKYFVACLKIPFVLFCAPLSSFFLPVCHRPGHKKIFQKACYRPEQNRGRKIPLFSAPLSIHSTGTTSLLAAPKQDLINLPCGRVSTFDKSCVCTYWTR